MVDKKKKRAGSGTVKIKLVRSLITNGRAQRETVRGLGLRRLNHVVERPDTPEIRGMVRKVQHLVEIVE
jgi:large subunit ribosomal protein L30